MKKKKKEKEMKKENRKQKSKQKETKNEDLGGVYGSPAIPAFGPRQSAWVAR
jgi:sortase (surface protein transpeptidase)